jgi:UDP-4-amino-4-deoxy-L-arabinose-oxoglutarate aminotransferase
MVEAIQNMNGTLNITHSKPYITSSDVVAVERVLSSGHIASGALTEKFEITLADYFAVSDVVTVGSGTAALQLSLLALGVGPKDEVILPTYVCRSVMDAVLSVGAVPVFCDIGDCWNMTPDSVETLISYKTKAIIIVHIFGISADTGQFLRFGVPLIEDCCQSFGLDIHGKKAGTIGAVGFFSFHATKCLTTGEGGMALSNNIEIIDKMRHILKSKRISSPLSDLQSALGLSQLEKYPEMLQLRYELAQKYVTRFSSGQMDIVPDLKMKSIYFRFPVKVVSKSFEAIHRFCERDGIHVRRGVDELLHRTQGFSDTCFPNAVRCYNETLSLPIYPGLLNEEQDHVIRNVQSILS